MMSMQLFIRLATALTMCCLSCAVGAWASRKRPRPSPLRNGDAALQAIANAFEQQYVFPEMRPRIVEGIEGR